MLNTQILQSPQINRYLRAHIDIIDRPAGPYPYGMHLVHQTSLNPTDGRRNLGPFKKYVLAQPIGPFDFFHGAPNQVLLCAVYVICKGSPPTWFQLRYFCGMGVGRKSQIELVPTGTERPKVAWRYVETQRPTGQCTATGYRLGCSQLLITMLMSTFK